ncbi:PaaI family thioesterase [Ottowia sp.]|uniref:PaaI family thioesterase n=1 Tax=Ottowia sp. TaxID=1898956 RepID=UPI0039E2845D
MNARTIADNLARHFSPIDRCSVRDDIDESSLFSSILRGELPLPPAAALLGLQIEHATRGSVALSCQAGAAFLNPAGHVQGGMLSAMLDEALSIAALSALGQGEYVVTLEMKVQFIGAATPGALHAQGRLVHRGGRIAFVEGELRQDGQLVARATATVLVRSQRG